MIQLIDSYNRHINYLRISITDRCNLRCIYCMPKEGISLIGHDDILSYEELLRIACIAVKKGITKIRITGGEPLARKGVVQFVSALSGIQGIQDLSMTTNGILLSPAAQPLRSAGLKRLNISLDSLNPDKYTMITRGGDINQIIAGMKSAQEAGFSPIKINVVVIRGINDDEITSFAKLSMEKNLQVRFIEYMPVGMENGWEKERFVSADEIRQSIKTIGPLLELPSDNGSGPAQMYTIEGAQGRLGFISALSDHFCATCNRLRLTPDGKLRTCLFSDAEVDLKTKVRQGCSDDALADIINEAILSKPQKHHATEQVFKKCIRGMSAIGG
ncbi:MAG: GTP 3',8-cyclase MoaA [Proteobacteria bacterium]|nr:GTP 3',8-cyclase MoaA [Pseudomonadota bacterium]